MTPMFSKPRKALAVAAVALGAAFAATAAPAPALADEALTPAQEDAVRGLVREYILDNPEIIAEAIDRLRSKQQAAAEQAQKESIAVHAEQLNFDPESPVLGNPDGDVTLVEFFDYQCGYCKAVFPAVMDAVEDDGDVRLVMKEFPILGPASVYAARAALAAREQDKYAEFHEALMTLKGQLTDEAVDAAAEDVGLDLEQLKVDMAAPAVDEQISANMALARALDIGGTPAFVVGDMLMPGAVPLERLQQAIAQAREES
ncbi:27kDa outer membrane protein [Caenispirillum salinarum AK4]|uniref:27kDa outer membrane protein n=1 Tax=Caenispirillum salinarum AK4 TaxID=1238182 RepID=K9GWR0_9PROT|nr:DsbA family protein [Caenispirillum salinarum]EKV29179.1 27kDa outer membrane protein [Caenispirillum salinarum AK4]